MSDAIHLIPVTAAVLCWYLVYRVNRKVRWFRLGEVIFWDVVLLIVIFLAWLVWF